MRRASLFISGLTLAICLPLLHGSIQPQDKGLQAIAVVKHPPIDEMSGIVRSRKYANTYWVNNDSGDQPRLFAIREDGSVIVPPWIAEKGQAEIDKYAGVRIPSAVNTDWEDITSDGDNLYIPDMGNNGNARRDLGIYVVKEPNPLEIEQARHLSWLPVAYEDQKEFPPQDRRFDCEAIFWLRGKIFAISKHRNGPFMPAVGANLYRLDTRWTDKVNKLIKVDGAPDLGGWVTGADVSPDGKTLAVLTQAPTQSVWLFETSAPGDKFLSKGKGRQIKFTGAKQCEAVCWVDNKTLLVTNEQRDIFKLKL